MLYQTSVRILVRNSLMIYYRCEIPSPGGGGRLDVRSFSTFFESIQTTSVSRKHINTETNTHLMSPLLEHKATSPLIMKFTSAESNSVAKENGSNQSSDSQHFPNGDPTSSSENSLEEAFSSMDCSLQPVNHLEMELREIIKSIINNYDKRSSRELKVLSHVSRLSFLLKSHPELSKTVWELNAVPVLANLMLARDSEVRRRARLTLALIGYTPRFKKRGLRILAIDGGGTRALIPIIVLKHLERLCNMKVYQMFDLICGTSSGAITAAFLCIRRDEIESVLRVSRRLGTEVFSNSEITQKMAGISNLLRKHAYYDAEKFENLIRDYPESERLLIDSAAEAGMPKLVFVSTIASWPNLEPHVFRNYNHHPDTKSYYRGCSSVKLWEALRASSAAPAYFEEFKIGDYSHHDGALLTNNPSAIGLHEAKRIWGKQVPIQCLVSLGTGKCVTQNGVQPALKDKLLGVMASVTDTEAVHMILKDIISSSIYFRFNPFLYENIPIDECDPKKLDSIVQLAEDYVKENYTILEKTAKVLTQEKTVWMSMKEKTLSAKDHLHLLLRKLQT